MADKLMYISNDNNQNYPFCILQLVVEMLGHIKILYKKTEVIDELLMNWWIRKCHYKTLGTSLISFPSLLVYKSYINSHHPV